MATRAGIRAAARAFAEAAGGGGRGGMQKSVTKGITSPGPRQGAILRRLQDKDANAARNWMRYQRRSVKPMSNMRLAPSAALRAYLESNGLRYFLFSSLGKCSLAECFTEWRALTTRSESAFRVSFASSTVS